MLGKPVLQTGLPSLLTPANPRPSIFKSSKIIKILIFVSLPYFYFDFKDCLVFFYVFIVNTFSSVEDQGYTIFDP